MRKFNKSAVLLWLISLISREAAVRLALSWGTGSATHRQYNAAWHLCSKQTIFPCCSYCRWPVLPHETHDYCEETTREQDLSDTERETLAVRQGLVSMATMGILGGQYTIARLEDNSVSDANPLGYPKAVLSVEVMDTSAEPQYI